MQYECLPSIEAYLQKVGCAASRLSLKATGSPNCVSQMRQGKAVAQHHINAIRRFMAENPRGEALPPKFRSRGGRRRAIAEPSIGVPVPGPSQMPPDLFDAIKAEAFRKRLPIVRFMEDIVRIGWSHYNTAATD